jgi:hypothetical protein
LPKSHWIPWHRIFFYHQIPPLMVTHSDAPGSSRAVLQGPRRSRRIRWRRWLRPESGRQISWHR